MKSEAGRDRLRLPIWITSSTVSAWRSVARTLAVMWRGQALIEAPIGNELGRRGEAEAARRLRAAGYRVLARNVRTKSGEADLVCRDPDGWTIVVVEVKTRRLENGRTAGGRVVSPELSITAHKRKKLAEVRRSLIEANGWQRRRVRVDAVAIELESDEPPRWIIRHHRDILGS